MRIPLSGDFASSAPSGLIGSAATPATGFTGDSSGAVAGALPSRASIHSCNVAAASFFRSVRETMHAVAPEKRITPRFTPASRSVCRISSSETD